MSAPICLPAILADAVVRLDGHTLGDALAHWRGEDEEMRRRFDSPTPQIPGTLDGVQSAIARWIRQRAEGGPQFAYALRDLGGVLAGGCELRRPTWECAHVSWWVFPAFRDRGLAGRAARLLCRAAFENMPELRTIEAHIDHDNLASRAVARNAGFAEQGQIGEATWTGAVVTRLRYALGPPVRLGRDPPL